MEATVWRSLKENQPVQKLLSRSKPGVFANADRKPMWM